MIHHYIIDPQGMITRDNMVIATEHNNIAYNGEITKVAKKYLKDQELQASMLSRAEVVIRSFKPLFKMRDARGRSDAG